MSPTVAIQVNKLLQAGTQTAADRRPRSAARRVLADAVAVR
jgi:hypothetical protein